MSYPVKGWKCLLLNYQRLRKLYFENKSVQQRSNEKVFKLKIKYNLYFTDITVKLY